MGRDKFFAEAQITNAGFVVGAAPDVSTRDVAAGGVYSQTPAAGTMATKGSTVTLAYAAPAQLASSGTVVSDSGRSSFTYLMLPLWVNAICWDASNGVLQVVTGNSSPTHPNSVISINPNTGAIVASRVLPKEGFAVAASSDGRYVYVGMGVGGGVQRLNAGTLTPDLDIPVGGPTTYIQSIAVSPVNSRTIAVSAWWLDQRFKDPGVAVFDDAVQRPLALSGTVVISDPNNPYVGISALMLDWTADGNSLFAFPGVLEMGVTTQGVSVRKWYAYPGGGLGARLRGNVVYNDGGQVFDTTGPIAQLGRFPYSKGNLQHRAELPASGKSFAPVDHEGRFVSGLPYVDGMTLQAADLTTFASIDSLTLYGVASATTINGRLHAWGTDGLAWGDTSRLVVGRGTFTQAGALATPATAPPQLKSGSVSADLGQLAYQVFAAGATDVIADTCNNLYVSTSGSSLFRPNSVVSLDPATSAVRFAAVAGSEPTTLAVSDDCVYVYAGAEESTSIARVDTNARTVDLRIPLTTTSGLLKARSLAVPPGQSTSVAAATKGAGGGCLANDVDVRLFDGATMRPGVYTNGYSYSVRDVLFGASASTLYGFTLQDAQTSQAAISLAASGTGLAAPLNLGTIGANTLYQDGTRMLHYDAASGRLISQFGDVFDTRSGAPPRRIALGTPVGITGQCGSPMGATTTDRVTGKVFFVTLAVGNEDRLVVETYDATTLSPLRTASITTTQLGGSVGYPLRLARSGTDRISVVTSGGYLISLQGQMLAP